MREKIYKIIEPHDKGSAASRVYNALMIITIIASIVPLIFINGTFSGYRKIELTIAGIFIVDYILRWITADFRYADMRARSFLKYPFSFYAIIDLISILAVLPPVYSTFRLVRLLRLVNCLRVFKLFRYSKSIQITVNVFQKQKQYLLIVVFSTIAYIMVTAILMLQVEPETVGDFFNSLYWATMTLTTVGYGDIIATTVAGKAITMISTLVGVAVLAIPAGIITAGYVEEMEVLTRFMNGLGKDTTDYSKAADYWREQETESKKMPTAELVKHIEEFLEKHNTCALATGSRDFVRCTPIEYNYINGKFYMFSEGGLKFQALKHNKMVSLAIFDEYQGFSSLAGLQIQGRAEMIMYGTHEYNEVLDYKKISREAYAKKGNHLHLIRVSPRSMDYLNAELKPLGYDIRQHLGF